MADLFDYLQRKDSRISDADGLNPVDALILSWVVSLPIHSPLPPTLGALASDLSGNIEGSQQRFAQLLAESNRFRHMRPLRFEARFSSTEEMQFAAITILTGDGHAFVSFRGTDATLVGWKENFNMAFNDEVPAQREAALYLSRVAATLPLPLRIGGHSKGGNLAMYAAARVGPDVQRRIVQVHNFDGPGLSPAVFRSAGYHAIEPRIESYLPESSIVGMLLEHPQRYRVIRSSAVGVMQHDPYSWQIDGNDFATGGVLSPESLYAGQVIRDWLASMSLSERETFVEALYNLITATDATTLAGLTGNWQRSAREMLSAFPDLTLRSRAALIRSIVLLLRAAAANL